MNDFTASNGVRIRVDLEGDYRFGGTARSADYVVRRGGANEQALREFFQAEADERLGRCRTAVDPDFVVYEPREGQPARVLRESTAQVLDYHRSETRSTHPSAFESAARAYFDAHPEPKPWHDAAAGEVWLIAFSDEGGGGRLPWTVNRAGNFTHPLFANDVKPADSTIVDGRRIWPAEVS